MRTLLQRSQTLVSDNQDKIEEDTHVEEALRVCGCPEWSFSKVKRQVKSTTTKKTKSGKNSGETSLKRPVIVIPCEQKVLEAIARIMKKYNVPVAMKFGGH